MVGWELSDDEDLGSTHTSVAISLALTEGRREQALELGRRMLPAATAALGASHDAVRHGWSFTLEAAVRARPRRGRPRPAGVARGAAPGARAAVSTRPADARPRAGCRSRGRSRRGRGPAAAGAGGLPGARLPLLGRSRPDRPRRLPAGPGPRPAGADVAGRGGHDAAGARRPARVGAGSCIGGHAREPQARGRPV